MKAFFITKNKSIQFRIVNIWGMIFFFHMLVPDVIAQSPLCESYPTYFCCEYVSEVELNGVKRAGAPDATGFSSGPGYFDYTGSSLTTLTAGNTYPVSVTVKTNSKYQEFVKIWFDFNGNGVLNDPGKLVFDQVNTFNGTYVYSGNITVPPDAFNGDVYIRVVMVYANSPALCGTYSYGTTIDLKATITGGIESHALNVNISGENGYTGGVISSPSGINTNSGLNSANFAESSVIQLTATPSGSANFIDWSGDISGSDNPISINMNEDKNVVANFGPPNASPVATNDNYTVITGEILSGNLLENDYDANGDDIEITVQPTLAYGVFNSFNLETGAFEYLAPTNWAGTFSFNYTIIDGQATSSGTATITVLDNIPPVAVAQNITIYLDADGQASVAAADIDNGSTDACGIATYELDITSFDCEDVGANTVTLTVTDVNSNSASAEAVVTVEDNIAPTVVTQNITVQLDANGTAKLLPEQLDAGSSDVCGIEKMEISRNIFGCDEQGDHTVTLTVWDYAGNKSTCDANVSIKDTLKPFFVPVSDILVTVDRNISEIAIDYPEIIASDNCTIIKEQVEGLGAGGIFPLGTTTETWVATDIAGNSTYLSFKVIVAQEQEVNHPPHVENPIDNQELHVSQKLKIPVSPVLGRIFNDSDNDVLTLEIYQEDTDTIPVWMNYENDTLTIQPTIGDTGCVNIVVQALDLGGLSAKDTFQVCVKDIPVNIDNILAGKVDLLLYPNPTQGEVIIEITSSSIISIVDLVVLDIKGRQIFNKKYQNTEKIIFDLSDRVPGMYFVKLNIDGNQIVKKLIVD